MNNDGVKNMQQCVHRSWSPPLRAIASGGEIQFADYERHYM